MNRIELLAPAGSKEALIAAISNGADAVYIGGKSFSARAFANNFDDEEVKECVEYAHLRNAKIYVAINTLLNDIELDNAIKQIHYYHSIGVDALIIQDLGLYYRILKEMPDFEIHASTQMHVHNLEGVKNVKKLGFKRTVIARESSKEFISEACKQGIEIEIFVHGAICASYSGQCLISAFSKNRSANKGMCAQCCRLKYKLLDKEMKEIETDSEYLLSAKDMRLINDMPSIIEAGVSSVKIEGRMKSPAYVGFITSLYRKAIDSYYAHKSYRISEEDNRKMSVLFNRNFTDKYYNGTGEDIYNNQKPNHLGIKIGEVIGVKNNRALIRLSDTLKQFDGVRIANYSLKNSTDEGFIVNYMYIHDKLVNQAHSGNTVELDIKGFIPRGSSLYKTVDADFEKSIVQTKEKKVPVSLIVSVFKGCPVSIQCDGEDFLYSYTSKIAPGEATKAPLSEDTISEKIGKLGDSTYYAENIDVYTDGQSFLRVSELNEIRREMVKKLDEYRLSLFSRDAILTDYEETMMEEDLTISCLKEGETFDSYPVINPDSSYPVLDNAIISEIGGLFSDSYKVAGYTMNVMNSYAYELLLKLGFKGIVVSSELNEQMFNIMCQTFKERNGFTIRPFTLRNTCRTLMHLKENPFAKYMDKEPAYLSDSSNVYSLKFSKNDVEIIEPKANETDIHFGRPFIGKA